MKVVRSKQLKKNAPKKTMSQAKLETLQGLTIDQALDEGLIDDVGDDEGGLIFESNKVPGVFYALVDNSYIQTSPAVGNGDDIEDKGELTFWLGESDEAYYKGEVSDHKDAKKVMVARLTKPRGLDLSDVATASYAAVVTN